MKRNIYSCQWFHFCGNLYGIVIATDKTEALKLFKEYDDKIGDDATIVKLGTASLTKKSELLVVKGADL